MTLTCVTTSLLIFQVLPPMLFLWVCDIVEMIVSKLTGGTTFDVYGNELGVYFSSGGFSDYFTRPSYQDTIGTNYICLLLIVQ